ncbi:MAG: mechanosensitive ion channel [Phycisphaera sp.]|nr:MAG: mechanosensitive ion channel [Phycisphaera sp.]
MPKLLNRTIGLVALLLIAGVALGQDSGESQARPPAQPEAVVSAPVAPVDAPTITQVQERIAEVEASTDLDQAAKDALLDPLSAALSVLQRRDTALKERQQFADASASAAGTQEQLSRELDQPATLPQPEDFSQLSPDAALDAIRALLTDAQARLDAAKAEEIRLETEATTREMRLASAPTQLVEWREELTEATTELAALPADPTDAAATARRWEKRAEAAEKAALIARLEAETASYTARREVLPLRQSLAQRKADLASRQIDQLRAAETAAANRKARQAQQDAQQQAADVADPELQRIAKATSEYATKRLGKDGTLARLEHVRAEHEQARQKLDDLQRRARNTAARVQAAGLTELVGRALRDELRNLPEIDPDASELLSTRMGQAQYELIAIEDELSEYGDAQAAITRARDRLTVGDEPLSPEVERQISSIINAYVDILNEVQGDYLAYYDAALNLETKRSTLAETTKAFRTFIEERILWTRSVQGSAIPSVESLTRGAVWLLGGKQATTTASEEPIGSQWLAAVLDFWPPPFLVGPVFLALFVSYWARARAKRALNATATQVRKFGTDRMGLTIKAIPLTILMGLPLPISLTLVGLLLTGTQVEAAQAVGKALFDTAVLAFVLEFTRHASRNDGLVDAHFRWRREGLTHFRRLVYLLEFTILPLAVIARAMGHQPDVVMNDALGRMAFIVAELVLAIFTAWLFAPWLPFVRSHLAKHPKSFVNQARWVWYPLLVAAPITLAVLAAVGYYYTAARLDERLHLTGWLVVAATIAYNLVLRWLFIERRKLLVKRAQQKREAEQAERAATGDPESVELEAPAELDAAEVDTQTRRVLVAAVIVGVVVGMYGLWAEQLPALRMLERVQLWPSVDVIDTEATPVIAPSLSEPPPEPGSRPDSGDAEQQASADPNPFGPLDLSGGDSGESEPIRSITLADVGAAFLFFLLTWVLARNLPGLLEITILKRLPLDSGARFAVTSILRYFIGIIGILLAFSAIGIGWSHVQFLAAALTFGLAFGLQEIFANFISGLIMLIERPVRVGDTVTVNNVNGRITRIRMRATTVLDWEMRELILPNKVFITEQFINWTLSDPRLRVTIPVGVSYGSDVRLVERTLLELGQSQDHVVPEPKVRALFLGFGDSTLNFELRVFVEHFDYFVEARSVLHTRIAERFRELDIEIAFPQRDLNIRDIGPLAEAMERRSRDARALPDTPQNPEGPR